jgi:hypothetical protein
VPGSFGTLALSYAERTEFIDQTIDYSDDNLTELRTLAIDSLGLPRLDLTKIDVKGMELELLAGARQTIARCLPIIIVERLKIGRDMLAAAFEPSGYRLYHEGPNMVAIHSTDPSLEHVVVLQA